MSEILVTGAAGFIGSAVAKKLISQGHEVWTIDNLSTGLIDNLPEGIHFIKGNTYDDSVIEQLGNRKFEYIYHIAGQSSGEVSFEDPEYDLNTNTLSTLKLLQYAKDNGCKSFVYASSMSAYGDNDNLKVSEETEPVPKSFYAVGKLASENYMRIYSKFGITCTALRFFNVYGPGQNMSNLKQGMASIYMAQAIDNSHIVVKGSKERFRDFVYIDDIVKAVLLAGAREGEGYKMYNVSTCIPTKVEKVLEYIVENMQNEISVEYVEGTPGDQFGIYGTYDKIKADLGWEPTVYMQDGIRMMYDWAVKTMKESN